MTDPLPERLPASTGRTDPAASIEVILVWLAADWPTGSPLTQGDGQPAFGLPEAAGRGPIDPPLLATRLSTRRNERLDDFLAHRLSATGRQAIACGRIVLAVHGKRVRPDQRLRDGDRIEFLGPILADPKSDRRARVRAEREAAGADKWRTRGAGRRVP